MTLMMLCADFNRYNEIERLWLFILSAWRQTLERGYYRVVWFPAFIYFWDEDDCIAKGYITATIHLLLTTDRDCSDRAFDITIADLSESHIYGSDFDGSPNWSTLRELKILTSIQHIPIKITISFNLSISNRLWRILLENCHNSNDAMRRSKS